MDSAGSGTAPRERPLVQDLLSRRSLGRTWETRRRFEADQGRRGCDFAAENAGFTTALLQDVIAHAACLHFPFAAAGSLSLQLFSAAVAASITTPKNPHENGGLQRR
jgi:hypothetical protein